MIHRRSFLQLVASLPLTLAGEAEVSSWPAERDYFHPFAPERVVILNRGGLGSPHWIREKLSQKKSHLAELSIEKFDLLITVVKILTDYYRVPQYFEGWADRLVKRERLGSTGIGGGLGIVHEFQAKRPGQLVRTVVNPPVDWWLFLLPEGTDYDSVDEKPVFALIGDVANQLSSAIALRILELTTRLNRRIDTGWETIASMDRVSAARFLNVQFALAVEEARLKGNGT